jgi:hypothetical protein
MTIVEVVNSIKQREQNLQELVQDCVQLWGELYWLNSHFQTSSVAVIMEKISTDIHYDIQKFNSLIFLN